MNLDRIREHWEEEGEAAFIYQALADVETNPRRRRILEHLVEAERKHQKIFADLLHKEGHTPGPWKPSLQVRLQAWMVRRGAASTVLSLRIAEESRGVKQYLRDAPEMGPGFSTELSQRVARDEANHAEMLVGMTGGEGEPWHQTESGGFLRNVVYGFNDGLTANFGLVMGVLGANAAGHFILLSGIAGLVADALSMGSSGYLAAKSEQEVYAHEIAMEREEMELMPEMEEEELALIYESKGMPAEAARRAARQVMADPEIALKEKAREELGITPAYTSPLREGLITGTATACGALIPVLPFLFGSGTTVVAVAFCLSMLSHFAVGAARSFFTGRGIFRSGLDMFLVGLGVALAGYLVGDQITRFLS